MGQRKLGLKRPFQIDVRTTKDEDEYLSRMSWKLGVSKTEFLRAAVIPPDFDVFLIELRVEQKGIKGIFNPRRKGKCTKKNVN